MLKRTLMSKIRWYDLSIKYDRYLHSISTTQISAWSADMQFRPIGLCQFRTESTQQHTYKHTVRICVLLM